MGASPAVIKRHAARVILLDPRDHVLLFHFCDPMSKRSFWITPGGGIESGESPEDAALRELHEETGIANTALSSCVWTRMHEFSYRDKRYHQMERFFVARVEATHVQPTRLDDYEMNDLLCHRWWSVDELVEATDECFAPRRIGVLLRDLLAAMPRTPIDVGV